MVRRCCATFDGKICRTNRPATKTSPAGEKGTVYRFPLAHDQRERWLSALPVQTEITSESLICSKHWPPHVRAVKIQGGHSRPTEPPSIFTQDSLDKSLQNAPRDGRMIASENRKLNAKQLEKELDIIDSWENLLKYVDKFADNLVMDKSDYTCIRLFKLSGMPPDVQYSILVKNNFHVEA